MGMGNQKRALGLWEVQAKGPFLGGWGYTVLVFFVLLHFSRNRQVFCLVFFFFLFLPLEYRFFRGGWQDFGFFEGGDFALHSVGPGFIPGR